MSAPQKPIRVLYSFPHKIGDGRICNTAWQQVNGLAAAGADITAFPGVIYRDLPSNVRVRPTLAWKKLRISYKAIGTMRALALHDRIVARRLRKLAGQIDIVHTWPCAALETLKTAAQLGITTVLERPNAHTRFAYEAVGREAARLGIILPPGDEYYFKRDVLAKEEEEYGRADYLLCPSDFVAKTFVDQGFSPTKLARHQYGFDQSIFHPDPTPRDPHRGLTVLFVGVCAVRKGLHFALEAWLRSPASAHGTFLIAGKFLPAYEEKLAPLLSHPSVKVLGQRNDVAEWMRQSDILVLPSIEEGFPLVVAEAMGSGCVALTSEACCELCRHMETGLVHSVGDIETLARQITCLHEDRALLSRLRTASLRTVPQITWRAAGARLLEVYRELLHCPKPALLQS